MTDGDTPERGGPQPIPRPAGAQVGGPPPWADRDPASPLTIDQIRKALAVADPPRPSMLERTDVRASAVLAPLFEADGEVHVVLTRRAQHLRSHQGEVSFPGGALEGGETHLEAALRESFEEIALDGDSVEVIGELDHLQTYSSRSYIVPFVGALRSVPVLEPNPAEVDKILFVPLSELFLPEIYREEHWALPQLDRPLYFFELYGDTIWGATAYILRNLLTLITSPNS